MATAQELQAVRPDLLPDPDVLGVYGRSGQFSRIIDLLNAAITDLDRAVAPEVMRFPPVIGRRTIERAGYVQAFPHLLGTVHSFDGDQRAHGSLLQAIDAGDEWSGHQVMTEMVLTPAACYAVYPRSEGVLGHNGKLVDVESWCFRREASDTPERMSSFRMREFVRLGTEDAVRTWRAEWITRAQAFLRKLGLQPGLAPASDPFFGTAGRLLASKQRELELKYELSIAIGSKDSVATISCNYHAEHFGKVFGIQTSEGGVAHSACVAFGLERLALGLYTAHGASPEQWPAEVQVTLGQTGD
jgi:seryl-tRNA synthetase